MDKNFKQRILQIVEGTADSALLHGNANKASERIPVMKEMIAGEVVKAVSEDYIPEEVLIAHKKGEIHYHDLDQAPLLPFTNCCLVDLKDMLQNGFDMGNATIEEPKSVSTACAITSQIIAQVASHQYGGVSMNRIDEVLEPYVTKSYDKHLEVGLEFCENRDKAVVYATKQTMKEVKDACQAMEYEINTLFTSQGQTPFVTFGFGLGTSWQARAIQEGILKQRIEGLGKDKRTAIFPKLVYMLDDGVNIKEGDPNYSIRKLAIDCASKRNYPDVLSMPMLRKIGAGCTPMGCRSFLSEWVNPETGELQWEGRNNLGVVSLNLPRIAIEARQDLSMFWQILEERLELAYKALDSRVQRYKGVKAKVAPIMYCSGAIGRLEPEDEIFQLFENGRASVSLGYIGLNEMVDALIPDGVPILNNTLKQAIAEEVVNYLSAVTAAWKEETGLGYSLYSTPSESLCDRFHNLDKAEFGVIENVTDKEYYTNSFHLDVRAQVSPMVKIDFEKPYHKSATAGHITFVEVPNVEDVYRKIIISECWDYAYTRVPYFGTNCSIDKCHECGWGGDSEATEEGFACGHCGNTNPATLEITKRVCGYLGNANARPFNNGKQKEVILRVKHK